MKMFKQILLITILIVFVANDILFSASENKTINEVIMEELGDNVDNPFFILPIKLGDFTFDFNVTKHVILITLAALLTIISMKYLAYKLSTPFKRPTLLQGILELLINYMSKDVLESTLGEDGQKYLPFCLTLFLFVLFANFIGLIPPLIHIKGVTGAYVYLAGSVGGNLGFTLSVSTVVFIVYNLAGMRKKGFIKYWAGLSPQGIPIILSPFLWFLEFITLINRALALTIRLFANMTGGHIMLIVIPYIIIISQTLLVSPFAVLFLGFIYVLEIFVAVLQAYVFSLLSAVYIGLAVGDEH